MLCCGRQGVTHRSHESRSMCPQGSLTRRLMCADGGTAFVLCGVEMNASDRKRAASKVVVVGSCWIWGGSVGSNGYGNFWVGGTAKSAHRVFYEWASGPIPEGLQIDHLCKNKLCVKPEHLEAVTPRENCMRSEGMGAINARKPGCSCGRPYDRTTKLGARWCSVCRAARVRAKGIASRPRCGCGADFSGVDSAGRRFCRECRSTKARRRRLGLI